MNPWWTDQDAGLFGGIAGAGLGILGGILGTLAGIFAPRGQCKGLVYGTFALMIIVGIICLVGGLAALCFDQPYGVYYPQLLIGIISTLVPGSLFPVIRQRYREAEARRLEAEEIRRS